MKKKLISIIVSTMIFGSTIITPSNCSAISVSVPVPTDYVTNDIMENESEISDNSATTAITPSVSIPTTTVSSQNSETNYDFKGAFFFKDYEWSYYVDDELNLNDLTFEVCVIDSNDTYSGEYIHNIFSYSSGNYSDLYTLDVSEVDMSKAGEYKIYLQTANDAIGTFYTNKTRYLTSGDYKVKMNGEKTSITISVKERPTTISTDETTVSTIAPTTTTIYHDTSFYFEDNLVIEKDSSDIIAFSNEGNEDVKFSIDDENIAILVDPESGLLEIRGISEGNTTIRAVSSDGTSVTADIKVIIPETTTTTTVCSETTTTTTTINDPITDSTTTTTSNKYLTIWYKDKPLAKNETITINYMTEYIISFTALGKVEAEPVSDKVTITVDNDNKLLHLYMNEAAYVYVILHDTESNEYYTLYAYASEMGSSTTSQILTTTSTTTTTTIPDVDDPITTSTVVFDYATFLEYDSSPMKVGETRTVRFYNPQLKTMTKMNAYEVSDNISYSYEEGSDTLTITALATGKARMYIMGEGCAFGCYLNIEVVDDSSTTTLSVIEQKLSDFVKEKDYDATVEVSEENVVVSFKQQTDGEKEYDATAITQEIKTFCENNAVDFSLVQIIFQANNLDSELPQTGYSKIYKVFAGLAALMTVSGAALVVKTRKENE